MTTADRIFSTERVLSEVLVERGRQDDQWGEQNHLDGTGLARLIVGGRAASLATRQKDHVDSAAREGEVTFLDILLEEVYEAASESNPALLRDELLQVAAVAVAWIEAIERRPR